MSRLLADEATLFADGGATDRVINGLRALRKPLVGATAIAEFVLRASRAAQPLSVRRQELNGRPALVFVREGAIFGALMLDVADSKIQQLYFQADPSRLRFVQ